MHLLEDILTDAELRAIEEVLESGQSRFDLLVKISGLDPHEDFKFSTLQGLNLCNADLRGFDFSGSDLRFSAKNKNTIIDETTILDDTLVDWIELEALPIVSRMQKVETATRSDVRQNALGELVAEFGQTTHVISYMSSAACRANTLEAFLDFAAYMPVELPEGQREGVRKAGLTLLNKKLKQSRSRTGRSASAIFAIEAIVKRLQEADNSLCSSIFNHLASNVSSKQQTRALRGIADISPEDLAIAFSEMGN